MVNVNLIYNATQQLILKDLGTGFFSPEQFNVFANMCTVEFFNKYAELYQNEQRITDKIRFAIKKSFQSIDATGKMDYPDNYVNKIAVRAYDPASYGAEIERACAANEAPNYNLIKQIKCKTIDNDKVGDRLSSSILAPTRDNPINTFYDDYTQFYPIDLGACVFEYLAQPEEVVWAYTIGGNGLPVYDAANSTNFPFDWLMRNEIIIKIASYFGLSIREDQLFQGANAIQQQQA